MLRQLFYHAQFLTDRFGSAMTCRALSSHTLLCMTLSVFLLQGCTATPRQSGTFSKGNIAAALPLGRLDTRICKTQVSNAPVAINNQISRASAAACVNGIPLMVNPAPEACLTSGFGQRNGRAHKGIDYQSKPAGKVVAAAPGSVITRGYRTSDFGNWVVIDHGSDVYTAYAHLASIDKSVTEGLQVIQGQALGTMGNSGPSWIRAIHLHYEVRTGNIDQARSFFNLKAIDPYAYPGSCPAS